MVDCIEVVVDDLRKTTQYITIKNIKNVGIAKQQKVKKQGRVDHIKQSSIQFTKFTP